MVEAIEHGGGGAGEAVGGGVFDAAGFAEDPELAGGDGVATGGHAGDGRGVAGDDHTFHTLGAQGDFDEGVGEVVAVGDQHGGEAVAGELPPKGIVMARDGVGDAVAEMGAEGGAGVDGGLQFIVGREVVAEGDGDVAAHGGADQGWGVGGGGGEG